MKKTLSIILLLAMITALLLGGCSENGGANAGRTEGASDYPSKPIEVVVPFGAGGGTDLVARIFANKLPDYLPNGQQVIVVNKEGGTATIGTTDVLTAAPDGYTLEFSIVSPLAIQPHFGETSYSVEDARAIIRVQDAPMVLTVKADSPWQTIEDLVEAAKNAPGEISCAITGNGSLQHLSLLELSQAAGIDLKIVSFTSDTDMMAAVVGGHVDCALAQAHGAKAQVEAGGATILLNLSDTILSYLKEVPTASDKGYDLTLSAFSGFYGPKDIPDHVVETIHDAVKQCMEDPEVIEQLEAIGVEPAYAGTEDYAQEIMQSSEIAREFLESLGMI